MKALAALLALTCGCSIVSTRSSPRPPRNCGGYAPAIVDTVLAAVVVALAVRSDRENDCDRLDGCHSYDPTPLYAIPILALGASAVWGYAAEASCRG